MFNKIAIIDFGGQYTHLIARRIRQLGIYSEIYLPENFKPTDDSNIKGIIFSGGPRSVTDEDAHSIHFDLKELKIPLLGICYGHQLIASLIGGKIASGINKEYGLAKIECDTNSTLFKGLDKTQKVWVSHGDNVEHLPEGFKIIAGTDTVEITAYESIDKKIFGLQFHPEVAHTENGMKILDNFLSMCTDVRDWKSEDYENEIIERIKKEAGNKHLLLLLSGGVDSLVSLMLCIKAIGNNNIFPLHIDTGFMRYNESLEISKHLEKLNFKNLKIINAEVLFLNALKNVVDPEEKRRIIGKLFVEIMQKELTTFNVKSNEWMLVQGTIYPDTIESGSTKNADKIKTHHNRVQEIEDLIREGRVIEPLKNLYKDEVRLIGRHLGLPTNLVDRHPFPGPGLAIRIIASNTSNTGETYNIEKNELNEILKDFNLSGKILPIRSVGVQGDNRTYRHPAVVWYKDTFDYSKDSSEIWNNLKSCSNKIVNNLKSINRVVFSFEDISNNLFLRKCYLEKKQIDLLRQVDALVMDELSHIKEIWQLPVVSLPLFDNKGQQAFVIRPVCSQDAMTADVYEMDFTLLNELIRKMYNIASVGYVFYDITTKPPATIEWE